MTDTQIIAAVRAGTHVLVPADRQWIITTTAQCKVDPISKLELQLDSDDEARDLAAALWSAETTREGSP